MALKDIFAKMLRKSAPIYLASYEYGMTPTFDFESSKEVISGTFKKNSWLYSCATVIANAVAGVDWEVYKHTKDGAVNIRQGDDTTGDILLNLLNNVASPDMQLTSAEMFRLWAIYLTMCGEAFFLLDNPIKPQEISPLYPWATEPIKDKQEFIKGFKYSATGASGKVVTYEKDEVMWVRFVDPENVYKGFAPVMPALVNVAMDREAQSWNMSNFKNKGVPPAVFAVKGGSSPEEKEGFRTMWGRFVGGNDRQPIVLDADRVTAEIIGMNPSDMDFAELSKDNRLAMQTALSVPGQAVGDPTGQTYANYREAMKALWEQTIIPMYLDVMRDSLNQMVASKYGKEYKIEFEVSNVSFLQEERTARSKTAIEAFEKDVITRNEVREALGYGALEDGGELFRTDILHGIGGDYGFEPETE